MKSVVTADKTETGLLNITQPRKQWSHSCERKWGVDEFSTLPSAMPYMYQGALAVCIVRKDNALFQEREDCLV